MSKLLLALQYWAGDKALAMDVARLIADMEPTRNEDVDFLFVSRFDCEHDHKTIDYVASKFKVFHYVNKHRRGTGWPAGCNDLWFGTMDFIYSWAEAKRMPEYDAILTFEADSSPLFPGWHRTLMKSWAEQQKKRPTKVFGAMVDAPKTHVNGNALFSGDLGFLYEVSRKIGGCPPIYGWDFYLTREFSRLGWGNCPLMQSYWQEKTMENNRVAQLIEQGVAFLHGVKDRSVLEYVRHRFVH